MFLFVLIWVLNVLISWWNAVAVGRSWNETKAVGGWPRVVTWSAAVMSACGFSWCILILLAIGGHAFSPQYVTTGVVNASLAMGFLVLAPSMVCSGLALWLESWKRAFREGGALNYGVAVYNTYAQIQNTVSMIQGMGEAAKTAGDLLKGSGKTSSSGASSSSGSSSDAGEAIVVAILLVVVSLIGGILLTVYLIRAAGRSEELPWSLRDRLAQSKAGFSGARRLQPA